MKILGDLLLVLIFAMDSLSISAESGNTGVFYIGVSSAEKGNSLKNSTSPFVVGYLRMVDSSDTFRGFDIAGKGTMLDSSWGQSSAVNQVVSYNAIAGQK